MKNCVICNVEYEPYRKSTLYCGSKCRKEGERLKKSKYRTNKNKARNKYVDWNNIEKVCIECGSNYTGNSNSTYCGLECKRKRINRKGKEKRILVGRPIKPCNVCKTEFEGHPNTKSCSDECKKIANKNRSKEWYRKKNPKVMKRCVVCDVEFQAKTSQISCSETCSKKRIKNYQAFWRGDNAEYLKESQREYARGNKEKIKQYKKEYYDTIRRPRRERRKAARLPSIDCKECKEMFMPKATHNKFCSKLCKDRWWAKDPMTNLCTRMRNGIHKCFKDRGFKKINSTFDNFNYTPKELVAHIESKFTDGMSWDNKEKWHIDHIRPVSSFNFDSTDHPDFKKCWSLNNLQPLWARDNLSKHNKWDGVTNI